MILAVVGVVALLAAGAYVASAVLVAFLGSETPAVTSVQTPAGERISVPMDVPARAGAPPVGTAALSPSGAAATTRSGDGACFKQFFSDVPTDRTRTSKSETHCYS